MPGPGEDRMAEMRSKGLLPAVGVGAAVYFVTGLVSISTLGLVGVGAGVGYGVGSWLADAYYKKLDEKEAAQGGAQEGLPWAVQAALQSWQAFLQARVPGGQVTPQVVEQLFSEFEHLEPAHANSVRALVVAGAPGAGGFGDTPVMQHGGATVVAPRMAAEV
uniref:Uncharacterized protein n=1 Tax=Zooxanthella nutricula TaxID=1333877 RepID=A0A7S2JNJ0_9DINO